MTRPSASLLAALAVLTAPALVGCGQNKVFGVDEFVAEANRNGAGLVPGKPLISSDPAREVYGVELEEAGGSLTVTPDSDAGRAEFERCDSAVSLLCYRAANVVVAFEDSLPVDLQARLEAAIVAMGSE